MSKIRATLTVIALATSVGGVAQAAPSFAVGGSSIFFNNYENLYRASNNCAVGCLAAVTGDPVGYQRVNSSIAGNVQVNDIFVGILNVQNITSDVSGLDTYNSTPGNRFTGYFAQQVNAIAAPGVGHATAHITLGTAVDPFGILAAGEMFRLYSDVLSFSSGGSATDVTANIALATSGTLWGALGLGTEGYSYTHTDLSAVVNSSNTENWSAMDLLLAGPGYNAGQLLKLNDFNEDEIGGVGSAAQVCTPAELANPLIACTDFVGSSEIEANNLFGSTSPWMFASNDPYQMVVPEPASLALVGVALIGLGWSRRRKVI